MFSQSYYTLVRIGQTIFISVYCQSFTKISHVIRDKKERVFVSNYMPYSCDRLKLAGHQMTVGRIRVSKSSYVFIIFLFLFVGSSPTQGDIFFMKSDIRWGFHILQYIRKSCNKPQMSGQFKCILYKQIAILLYILTNLRLLKYKQSSANIDFYH